jgi:hypothetical protein
MRAAVHVSDLTELRRMRPVGRLGSPETEEGRQHREVFAVAR